MTDDRRRARDTAGAAPEGELKPAKGKRSRSWDKAHRSGMVGYRIGAELKTAIEALAAEHDISSAEVARQFLHHALDEYRAGRLKIK